MYASIYASFVKKHLPLALQGIAFAVLLGWALDAHVPGLHEPIVPELPETTTEVQVQPLPATKTPPSSQVFENKAEIKSFKEQVEAAKARQWKQAADQVTQVVVDLASLPEIPTLDNIPRLDKIPRINEPPDPNQGQTFSELTSIEEKQQILPPAGSDLPLATSPAQVFAPESLVAPPASTSTPVMAPAPTLTPTPEWPQIEATSPSEVLATPKMPVIAEKEAEKSLLDELLNQAQATLDAVKQATTELLESAEEGLASAQEGLQDWADTAKNVVNETAADATEPVPAPEALAAPTDIATAPDAIATEAILPSEVVTAPITPVNTASPVEPDLRSKLTSQVEETLKEVSKVASDLVEVAKEGLEATKEGLQNWAETAKTVVNETAAAATEPVTHVANAVAAEVATPTVAASPEAPVATPATAPAATAIPADSPATAEVQAPATPVSIESPAEVLANAPASVPAESQPSSAAKLAPSKAKAEVVAEEPPTVVLKEIRFKGAKYFSNESLQAMVAKFLGIPLQYNDLLDIGYAVENFYKKNNHLARVMLTQQDVTEGILTLDVIESKLSKITVDQQLSAMPGTQDHVLALIEEQHPKGSTFNADQIDRALALANEVPGVSVSGALKEGGELGETELILKLYQNHGRQAELVADNIGSRATGADRLMGNLTLINPSDRGDALSLSTIITRGSEYLRGAYSLPIGLDGWRLGLNGSAMGYKVIKGDMGVVGGTGEAYTEGVELSYPLDRSPESSSTFSLSAEAKQFKNVMATGQVMTDYDAEVLVAQFSGVDRAFTKTSGVFNYNFQLTHGQISLHDSGMTNAQTDLNKINGNFNKLRTNITFIEPWTPKTDVYVGFTGQLADKNLDSSEKFQLGGAMGVRAYPTGEGSGSDGRMLNLEIRHRLDNGVTVTGFYDWGHVEDLHTPNPASNNSNNSYDLKGFGLSGAYTFRNGVTAKATWATREGDNPNPKIPSGTDQDGSRDRNRFWLQMTVPF